MRVVVTLADGSARESSQTWADGVSDCPWCEYPMLSGTCGNPACDTQLDAVQLAERRAGQQRAADAAERERRSLAYMDARRAEREAAETQAWAELSARAESAGQCLRCLRRSPWQSGYPRFVRHRDAGNCPHSRR